MWGTSEFRKWQSEWVARKDHVILQGSPGQGLIPGCEQQLWGASKSSQSFRLGQHDWGFEGGLMQARDGSLLKFSLPSSSPPWAFQERNGGRSLMAGLSQQISLSFCTYRATPHPKADATDILSQALMVPFLQKNTLVPSPAHVLNIQVRI